MKNIFLIVLALLFAISVSAHESTKKIQYSLATSLKADQITNTHYTANHGGIIQFIYSVFHKAGKVFYTAVNETPTEEDTDNNV